MTVLVIAEAGVNHNGDLQNALKLVDVAANAGADIVKFQTFVAEDLVTRNAPKAKYQIRNTKSEDSQFNMLKSLELSGAMHEAIINHCKEMGIEFLSTGFDVRSLEKLVEMGIQRIKVPSGELTNLPYLEAVAGFGLPVIMSTGMATLDEVTAARDVLVGSGLDPQDLTLLHCTTNYPSEPDELNLKAIQTIAESFGPKVGFSDHSLGHEAACAAVALGAVVVEKHITLDKKLEGPDQAASMEPGDFKKMVKSIRNIEKSLGNGFKQPTDSEIANMVVARKSIVAACKIAKGEGFTSENLTAKRPGNGISPMRWYEIIGRPAGRSYLKDELIEE